MKVPSRFPLQQLRVGLAAALIAFVSTVAAPIAQSQTSGSSKAAAFQAAIERAGEEKAGVKPDVVVRSTPQNVVFGGLPIGFPPIATVTSGQVVRIDSLTQQGASGAIDPATYYGVFGVQ